MSANGGNKVVVLYTIVNSESDSCDSLFNAFTMNVSGPKGLTLASVKQNCAALRGLSHLGPDGYHWRVCVEDKPVPGEPTTSDGPTFSWWDIQDENAKLPIKQASQYRLSKLFAPHKEHEHSNPAKAARGAFQSLGKAMSQAVTGDLGGEEGPPVPIVAFKLLDLVKLHDEFSAKHPNGRGPGHKASAPPPQPRSSRPNMPAPSQGQRVAAPPAPASRPPPAAARVTPPPPRQPEASLMDFGPPSSAPPARRPLHHSQSSPASMNESRAERLKREYAQKNQKANRVWDEIDQRWVEVDPRTTSSGSLQTSVSEPPGSNNLPPKKKEVGISLDPANAIGKSATVQAAVHQRVNEMRESQEKALQEIRDREQKKKAAEAEEDMVRKKLEPTIKAWSEEHGKKKQLRALLASLHTILWPGADWKPISIGDVLDDSKLKKFFHKASRVVHPDKTHHLDADKRFLAKRIFDALSQAKTEFDNGSR
ncbi:hypothetical protein FisN_30Lh022 [Fistulifera solaris]|uniref:J domain-containing protein n=1 Tax=Fistulifera solaris TaxID=1519565 RepID=A0A1Z5JIH5_FISSO|nr:hypothetical protein FisN_30Lh022 [Fistulifera solaris]|eukprot:GAX13736.1 hypothetical protein FisN_30Lh022 [Fistulifera solaris]